LLGILLARTVRGLVAQVAGWRGGGPFTGSLLASWALSPWSCARPCPASRRDHMCRTGGLSPRRCACSSTSPCCVGGLCSVRAPLVLSACSGQRSPSCSRLPPATTAMLRSGSSVWPEWRACSPPTWPAGWPTLTTPRPARSWRGPARGLLWTLSAREGLARGIVGWHRGSRHRDPGDADHQSSGHLLPLARCPESRQQRVHGLLL